MSDIIESHPEYQYLNTLREVVDSGTVCENRTGVNTRRILGVMHKYDFKHGFPLFTTKKTWFKGIAHELLWFLSGSSNIKYLIDNDVHIWDDDAYRVYKDSGGDLSKDEFVSFIKDGKKDPHNATHYGYQLGDLGPVYGVQWRNWWQYRNRNYSLRDSIDQLADLIDNLKNNPTSRRHILSAWNVADLDSMGLPPCFPAGHLVHTERGFIPIEEVKRGDQVFTSEGNWLTAYDIQETPYNNKPLLKIQYWYNNQDIVCTPNHPFLIKDKGYIEAKDVQLGDYVAIRRQKVKDIIPTFHYDVGVNQYQDKKAVKFQPTLDDAYMMGYFLGDGWTMPYGNRCCFAISHKDKDKILPKIRKSIKVSEKPSCGVNVSTYQTKSKKWYGVLSNFGHKAHNKHIPYWVYDMPLEYIKQFLEGYKDADGHRRKDGEWDFTTTSEQIAYGLQFLFSIVGKVTSISFQKRPSTTIIEGRLVNQRDTFSIKTVQGKFAIVNDDFIWLKVRKVSSLEDSVDYVYNFSVDRDHTYTVNNIVTHNCHVMSQYTVENGKLWCHMYQRSCDMFLGVPFNVASYSLLTYMLAQVCNLEPGGFIHTMHDCHIYENHLEAVEEQLTRTPNEFPQLELNPDVSTIDDFTYQDLKIVNYNPHSTIKAELNVG